LTCEKEEVERNEAAYGLLAVEAVHGDATEEFRVEIGGFLGHDFAGCGDFHDLVNGAGIQEEGNLCAAGIDGVESGRSFALVSEMGFGGDGLRSDAESRFEDSFVKKHYVEFALERRDTWEQLGEIGAVAEGEEVEGTFFTSVAW
jgi:hypothetical protein